MKKIIRLAVLLLSLTFLWGCELALVGVGVGVGAGLGVGAYRYIEGSVEKDYPVSYTSSWSATNTALANLYIGISNSLDEGVKGKIEGTRKDGERVIIKLTDKGQGVTAINIRVGFFGNVKDAERIHEEISATADLK
jgi:hypothetical protein